MTRTSNTNDILTRPRIFFRVPERDDALFEEIVGSWPTAKLREFTRSFMTPWTKENRETLRVLTDRDRAQLSALTILARAISITPGGRAAKDLLDAAHLLTPALPLSKEVFSDFDPRISAKTYAGLLNEHLRKTHVRVVPAKRGELPVPAIVCDDIRTACFCWAAYRGLEKCPACGKLFAANPERRQKFCSTNCGQRIYQRRFRRRKKRRSK